MKITDETRKEIIEVAEKFELSLLDEISSSEWFKVSTSLYKAAQILKHIEIVGGNKALMPFDIGNELEYYLWNSPNLEHGERVEVKNKATGLIYEGEFEENEFCFHLSPDHEIKVYECKWRRIFPENIFERAARNLQALITKQANGKACVSEAEINNKKGE